MNAHPRFWSAARAADGSAPPSARLRTLVLDCLDGWFGNQCDRFACNRLSHSPYDWTFLPGGAAWLAAYPQVALESATARDALESSIEHMGLKRVILIAHSDCAFYRTKLGIPAARCELRQQADLLTVSRWLRRRRPLLQVAAYYARRHGARVEFQRVLGAETFPEVQYYRISLPVAEPEAVRDCRITRFPAGDGFG